ncbi:MAG: hypothetical protein OEV27_09455, partial [Nitrospira sp.]|nr:hypothetical protein [Nitrospira sp.]
MLGLPKLAREDIQTPIHRTLQAISSSLNLEKAVALSDWIRFGGAPRRRTGGREHEFGKCALE